MNDLNQDSNKQTQNIVIKKYANRRLYNKATSQYVTLEDLANMVRASIDFKVIDAKNDEDITHSILTQIIVEQESRGQNLLPVSFLRELIKFYGQNFQGWLPNYLDMSMAYFKNHQEHLNTAMNKTYGTIPQPLRDIEVLAAKNMDFFKTIMSSFSNYSSIPTMPIPSNIFSNMNMMANKQSDNIVVKEEMPKEELKSEIEYLKEQISQMKKKLEVMA
jgi:polyhydroxyalkanoate synthesis repressor PhaR